MPSDSAGERLLVNAAEAARLLSIGKTLLWELTTRGELPHVRLGRVIRYDPAALRDWITARQQETAQ